MDRLLNVTTVLSIILLVMVLVRVRRAHIRVEYSVSWLLAAAAMLVLSRARPLLDAVRNLDRVAGSSADSVPDRRRRLSDHVFPLFGDHFAPARRQHRAGAARGHSRVSPCKASENHENQEA